MGDSADTSLLADSNSFAPSTLERATLTKQSRSSLLTNGEYEHSKHLSQGSGEGGAFWALVVVLLLLAVGNLLLTFFAMGVLRLGYGMESIELIPGVDITKFYGRTDLGEVIKKDGLFYGYADSPFSITGDKSKVSLSLQTNRPPPTLEVTPKQTEIRNVKNFQVVDPHSGKPVFTTSYPNFGLPRGVKNLNVSKTETSRVTSSTWSNLRVTADSTIRLKGNEGLNLKGSKLTWTADEDIYIKAINGSVILDGKSGIFVEVNTLPLVDSTVKGAERGQYKLCVCWPHGQLYRVPVSTRDSFKDPTKRLNCASFTNPCSAAQ